MNFLEAIGILLSAYAIFGMLSGAVYAKSGTEMKRVARTDEPLAFWTIVSCYLLAGQMIFWGLRYHLAHG